MHNAPSIDGLVVLGSTVTALAVVRDCHRIGLPCRLIDNDSGPASHTRLADVELLENEDSALEALGRIESPDRHALIADSDRWLRWLVKHRKAVEAMFGTILHPPNPVLETCLNKSRFVRWCKDHSLPVPEFYEIRNSRDISDVNYPVLVRPEITRHGAKRDLPKAMEVHDAEQLETLLQRFDALGVSANICQSLLRPNVRQFSVGVAHVGGRKSRILVAQKVRPTAEWCAGGTYVVTRPNAHVMSLVENVVVQLGLFGIAEVEVMEDVDSGELFLIEVNARPWVQYALAPKSGFGFLEFLLSKGSYDARPERTVSARWLSVGDDFYTVFSRSQGLIKSGQLTIGEYFRTVATANVFPLWSWIDPQPWFAQTRRWLSARFARRGGAAEKT